MNAVGTVVDNTCNLNCQYDWLAISSNFFNISVYTPALVIGIVGYMAYRQMRKLRSKK